MLFNSPEFAVFLLIVFILYWAVPARFLNSRNLILLGASYVFYSWWDWRFLSLIVISSIVDYTVSLKIAKTSSVKYRKFLLILSVLVNLGILGTFKYYNFFIENLVQAFTLLGLRLDASSLNIILPVGISFYTFQTMSYSIDVYRRKLEPTNNPIAFFAYVAFFPQLVAGPIERASNLLPQFFIRHQFNYAMSVDGLRQILWGLFKKVVVADSCAVIVDKVFLSPSAYSSSTLVLAAVLFAFQIYGDFSGYSDIAIGVSKLFGFHLKQNFAFPYFSRDIAEFWRRWHISLTSWFRDYLYISLGGSRVSRTVAIRNTMIVFLVSGLWHGANWTFIVWGMIHALLFVPLLLSGANRKNVSSIQSKLPRVPDILRMLLTFILVDAAWVVFRAPSIRDAFVFLKLMLSSSIFSAPAFLSPFLGLSIVLMLVVEWADRQEEHGFSAKSLPMKRELRWLAYLLVSVSILLYGGGSNAFIYFQF